VSSSGSSEVVLCEFSFPGMFDLNNYLTGFNLKLPHKCILLGAHM